MLRGRGIAEKESIHNLLQGLLIMSGIPNYAEHTRAISTNLAVLRSDHPDLM